MTDYKPPPVPALPVPPPPPTDPAQWRAWYERAWFWLEVQKHLQQDKRDWDAARESEAVERRHQDHMHSMSKREFVAASVSRGATVAAALANWSEIEKAFPPPPFNLG